MKKKDFLIGLCIIAAAALLYLLPRVIPLPDTTSFINAAVIPGGNSAAARVDDANTVEPEGSEPVLPVNTLAPAECYLLVTVGNVLFEPYPLLEERHLPITQADEMQNLVHISEEGFYMASASCDNQDCVSQGSVSLENRNLRLLGNQVICLPNKVILELLNYKEAMVVWENAHRNEK